MVEFRVQSLVRAGLCTVEECDRLATRWTLQDYQEVLEVERDVQDFAEQAGFLWTPQDLGDLIGLVVLCRIRETPQDLRELAREWLGTRWLHSAVGTYTVERLHMVGAQGLQSLVAVARGEPRVLSFRSPGFLRQRNAKKCIHFFHAT